MLKLVELASKIVLEHGAEKLTADQIVEKIKSTFTSLKLMEAVEPTKTTTTAEHHPVHHHVPVVQSSAVAVEDAFGQDEVKCMLCGQGGMKILKQHLNREHHMSPVAYRERFGLPPNLPLVAGNYHEQRRKFALASGLGHTKVKMTVQRGPQRGRRADDKINHMPVTPLTSVAPIATAKRHYNRKAVTQQVPIATPAKRHYIRRAGAKAMPHNN
jgi:predicted transcriptional regulator